MGLSLLSSTRTKPHGICGCYAQRIISWFYFWIVSWSFCGCFWFFVSFFFLDSFSQLNYTSQFFRSNKQGHRVSREERGYLFHLLRAWWMFSGWPGACKDVSECLGSVFGLWVPQPGCWLCMKNGYRVTKLTVSHRIGSWPSFQPQLLVGALVTSAGLPHSLHGLSFDLLKSMHTSIYRTLLGLYFRMAACPYGSFVPWLEHWV